MMFFYLRSKLKFITFVVAAAGIVLVAEFGIAQDSVAPLPDATKVDPTTPADQAAAKVLLEQRSAKENIVNGRIKSVQDKTLNIQDGEDYTPYLFDENTTFEIDGRPGLYSDLPIGGAVEVYPDPDVARRIKRVRYFTSEEKAAALRSLPIEGERMQNQRSGNLEPSGENETGARVDPAPVPNLNLGMEMKTTKQGVLVTNIDAQSPAYRDGLRQGDLILSVGETNLLTHDGVLRTLAEYEGNQQAKISVMRGEQVQDIALTLPSNHKAMTPSTTARKSSAPATSFDNMGWTLSHVGDAVVIAQIEPVSIIGASKALEGDEISMVNGTNVKTPDDVKTEIRRSNANNPMTLTLQRGTETIIVTLGNEDSDTEMPSRQKDSADDTRMIWDALNRQQAQISDLKNELQVLKRQLNRDE